MVPDRPSVPPLSVLDLAPVPQGATPADALHRALDLARHAERWGYRRYWLAEHHNMTGIASAATAVAVGYVAAGTTTIRVGSGGVMLPNHAPLVIAEQFGTLETLYPGRIDLGLGRAPGTDGRTLRALRRDPDAADSFPQDVMELQALLGPSRPGQAVHAIPGAGTNVPIWILGSSLFGAQLAAMLGLPYAFASHFAPAALDDALAIYRERFRPSAQLDRPHAAVLANVICADTDAEARRLFTSAQQSFTGLLRGTRGQLPLPVEDIDATWLPAEAAQVGAMLACSLVGSPATVSDGLARLAARTGADELVAVAAIHDHRARLRSYELLASVRDDMARDSAPQRSAA